MYDINNKTDEEIVESVKKGNKEMYAHIIRRYQAKLTRYATYLIGDHDKASDAVQESFIKAYVNLNGFDIKRKFSSWIYRIVHNESMNIIAKHKKVVQLDSFVDYNSVENLEDSYIKSELISQVRECLDQTDLLYREPLSLFYLEDKSYSEISDILRLPMGTIAIRIKRAKIIMRKICQTKMK